MQEVLDEEEFLDFVETIEPYYIMGAISNARINFMILEQIFRVTGVYKQLCDEHEFLDPLFKQAKKGNIVSLFQKKKVRDGTTTKEVDAELLTTALHIITKLTAVPEKYWAGDQRLNLGIWCTDENLSIDGETIETVDLSDDAGSYLAEVGSLISARNR